MKNTNTTTNTNTNVSVNTQNTTIIEKEVIPMKSTTSTTTTTTPIIFNGEQITKMNFKRITYDGYIHYVALIEKTEAPQTTAKALKPLFEGFGIPFEAHSMYMLTMMLTAYGTQEGDKVRKVKSISTFRKFLLEGYAEMMTKKVVSSAGKAPAAPKAKTAKAKKPTKDQQIAALKAERDALKEQLTKVQG